jgi:hypothetical protein
MSVARAARERVVPVAHAAREPGKSAAIGFVLTLATERAGFPHHPSVRRHRRAGRFTTFSAFSWETLALARTGHVTTAAGYVLLSVLAAWPQHSRALRSRLASDTRVLATAVDAITASRGIFQNGW